MAVLLGTAVLGEPVTPRVILGGLGILRGLTLAVAPPACRPATQTRDRDARACCAQHPHRLSPSVIGYRPSSTSNRLRPNPGRRAIRTPSRGPYR